MSPSLSMKLKAVCRMVSPQKSLTSVTAASPRSSRRLTRVDVAPGDVAEQGPAVQPGVVVRDPAADPEDELRGRRGAGGEDRDRCVEEPRGKGVRGPRPLSRLRTQTGLLVASRSGATPEAEREGAKALCECQQPVVPEPSGMATTPAAAKAFASAQRIKAPSQMICCRATGVSPSCYLYKRRPVPSVGISAHCAGPELLSGLRLSQCAVSLSKNARRREDYSSFSGASG